MTGSEVDALVEAAAARQWEDLNEADPYESLLMEAADAMKLSSGMIGEAENYLMDAVSTLFETPMKDRVSELLEALQDLDYSISVLQEKYGRGERE